MMKLSLTDPRSHSVIKNYLPGDLHKEMEELRRVDPDGYAYLSEFIILSDIRQ